MIEQSSVSIAITNPSLCRGLIGIGRAHSSPLPVFLRIPLSWLHSTTYAFYPDESHSTIRRVFTPRYAPHTKRHFCGFCGTPLSHWSEESRDEAEWVCVSMGSLDSASVSLLNDAGLLPTVQDKEVNAGMIGDHTELAIQSREGERRGQPWFEEMIEGSELGKLRRRRGVEMSADGRTTVEWEIVEFNTDEAGTVVEGAIATGKRKHGDMGTGENLVMREEY